MDRRTFMTWVGLGLLANSLPIAIAASAAPKVRSDGFVSVGTLKQLRAEGVLQGAKVAGGPVIVIPNPQDPKALVALSASCTHKGCPVTWRSKNQQFVCQCHGSKFKANGAVLTGPASKALATFKVKVEGGMVLVKPV